MQYDHLKIEAKWQNHWSKNSTFKAEIEEDKEKLYVLDTSVIIYDYNALKNFEEHDIAIPITVLEELDNFKKGNDT